MLGGAPAVWNTCLMYFQALLLLGYLYAHASVRYLSTRRQLVVHGVLLVLCFAVLPIAIPRGWLPPASSNVIPWLLLTMTITVGAPFFVLSATAPLLQSWIAGMDEPVKNPFVLYAASNAGSFLGLLAFPLLLEPRLKLGEQSHWWMAMYVVSMLLVAASGRIASGRTTVGHVRSAQQGVSDSSPSWTTRAKWIALAFVPSSLLLGVTTFLSTDIASTPLLWVIPLSLYLLTFVIVFARGGGRVRIPAAVLHALVITAIAIVYFWQMSLGFRWGYALHLTVFTLTALVLHGELSASRPSPAHLTEYYLWMSLGGALGGAFTALAVPMLFKSTRDYILMLALACFLRPSTDKDSRAIRIVLAFVPALILVIASKPGWNSPTLPDNWFLWSVSAIAASVALYLRRDAIKFGVSIGAIVIAAFFLQHSRETIYSDRSFFGIYRVSLTAGPAHILYHGSTIHGAQFLDSARRLTPITYYHPNGPVGQVFHSLQQDKPTRSVGVVGLGTGSILCYSRPGERWTFFEIDPHVRRIAATRSLFTFLSDCPVRPRIVIGDARLTLAREPASRYSMLVLDAFSSDAIPVHLLTKEALAVYRRVLDDHGILLVHISNRRLNLEPVVSALAHDAGMPALIRSHDAKTAAQDRAFEYGSDWVVVAKHASDLAPLASDPRWRALRPPRPSDLWTDDYSNLFNVIKW